jgi:GntR family transcriptional regulator, transcriptional repressor for pyruvate dehydrogenase complex
MDMIMFEPVRPARAYELIIEQIEAAIFDGTLAPGSRLPSERALMTQFNVSRSTVREALRVLQSDGKVQSRPGDPHGPIVLPFSTAALHKSMAGLVRADTVGLAELLQFRIMTEGCANQLAARFRTDAQLAAMEAALAQMEQSVGSGEESFAHADMAFHDLIAGAAGNKLLQVANEVVRSVVLNLIKRKITQAPDRGAQMRDSCRRHALVLDAVRRQDPALACTLARRHIFEYYAPYLDDTELPRLLILMELPGDQGSSAA